jgi:hypothetical protein
MKLSINTSFTENTSSQFLLILVDSENTQHLANAYQINDLNNLIEATQFKAAFNETLSLIGQIPTSPNTALVGVGKEEMGIWAYPMILVIYAIAAALFSRKQKLAPKIKKTLQRAGS